MQDPWYGHRDPLTGEPRGDRDEWIAWDYSLVATLQLIEDNTDGNGLLHWVTQSERVDVIAEKKTDKFQAAVARKTKGSKKKPYEPSPGEYFTPKIDLRGGEYPTYREFIEKQIEEMNSDGTMDE